MATIATRSSATGRLLEFAERLHAARKDRTQIKPFAAEAALTVDDAYAIAGLGAALRLRDGENVVGFKVGLTGPRARELLGANEPDFGALTDVMGIANSVVDIVERRLMQPRLEIEIALILGRELSGGGTSPEDAFNATAYVAPAFEVVDSRVRDWEVTLADTVADNASSAFFALGPRVDPGALRWHECEGRLLKNGIAAGAGAAGQVFGSPFHSLAWLARTLGEKGGSLQAGDVVLTGSLITPVPISAGDIFEMSITGMSTCGLTFC